MAEGNKEVATSPIARRKSMKHGRALSQQATFLSQLVNHHFMQQHQHKIRVHWWPYGAGYYHISATQGQKHGQPWVHSPSMAEKAHQETGASQEAMECDPVTKSAPSRHIDVQSLSMSLLHGTLQSRWSMPAIISGQYTSTWQIPLGT